MKSLLVKVGQQGSSVIFASKEQIVKTILGHKAYRGCNSYLIVCDTNVAPLFSHDDEHTLVLPAGEGAKNFSSINMILDRALQMGLTRNSLFIGVGGGVICDMCAFAASIYKRGAKLALVPTTLLSMVDAAIGGKTGIDFNGYKNQVGTFYPASLIVISIDFLKSLPYNQYRSGLAEVIKSALLHDKKLFSLLVNESAKIKKRDLELLQQVVVATIKVKAYYVERDFTEQNIRAHLNLGHTFAHALEAYYECGKLENFISHGDAVAWGLLQSNRLAQIFYSGFPKIVAHLKSEYKTLLSLLQTYEFPLNFKDVDSKKLLLAMRADKKNLDSKIRFVIQPKFFKTLVVKFNAKELDKFDFTISEC